MNKTILAYGAFTALLLSISPAGILAADLLPSVQQRFQSADTEEVPDFQRHLSPLLGKLGCNGRACHGSFQGRGGFRLSLFGYDFRKDHEQLMERIDTDAPADSYALLKATNVDQHEGGKRMEVGSWEYNLFRRWIQGGARPQPEQPAELLTLEVTPEELIFTAAQQQQPLKVVAVWSDGTREDVTCLCRFQSNDDAICEISVDGLVTSGDSGDTHVVVFYDNAVVPVPVIRPVSDQSGDHYPNIATNTPIDGFVVEKLRKLGILPSEVCTDAEFLRRVTLDITGTLPTSQAVREFLADSSPDKRSRKIDELLETPAYSAWWTTKLCDWTGCNNSTLVNLNPVRRQNGAEDWYDWIYHRIETNVPYDDLVEGIVLAQSRRPKETYTEYCERMNDYCRAGGKTFADQPGLIYYWGRNNFRTDEDRAIGFAYSFMGTRIQCAQCHKHPFDVWTKDDFDQFKQFFDPRRITFARSGSDPKTYRKLEKEIMSNEELLAELKLLDRVKSGKKLAGGERRRLLEKAFEKGYTIPFPELVIKPAQADPRKRRGKGKNRPQKPKEQTARLLGGQVVNLASMDDPRVALMDWLRNDEKQIFAKAFVNRVWANYFHRGIVEPTDDLSLANPPANQALLDYLAKGFVEHGYDMKWLHREICRSDTYQRSWRPNESNIGDERNFSRAVHRRLPAEVAYDALAMATANDKRAATFLTDLNGRGIAISDVNRRRRTGPEYVLSIFGRSTRESNCDCDRSEEASLLQVVFLQNDREVYQMIDRQNGWIAQLNRSLNPLPKDERIRNKIRTYQAQLQRFSQQLERLRERGNPSKQERVEALMANVRKKLKQLRPDDSQRKPLDPQPIVEEAYLRTVSRFPTDQERQVATAFIQDTDDTTKAIRDLLWSLVNTKEFIVNH